MYSPALFFLSSATSASRPIAKFLITICSKSCPAIKKLPERTVCVQSREFLDGWNNLCIPACLKFNYKMFIPTSLGRRLFGPAHKKEDGTYYHVQSHSLFSVQYHLRIPAYRKVLKIKIGLKTELKDWGRSANIQKNRHQTSAREHQRAFSGSNR